MRRIFLELLAQLVYYHAKVLRFFAVVRPPHSLQHPLMRKRLPLLNHESAQDVEFFRSQVNSLTTNVHDSSLEIHPQFRTVDLRKRLPRRKAAPSVSNPRQQSSD